MKLVFPAVLAVLSGTAALATGSYDISGTSEGQSDHTYVPMGEGRIFIDMNSTFTLSDNGTPMAGMAGTCFGYMDIAIGQGAQGGGVCTWSDADGDTWFGPWEVTGMTPDQATAGTWYVAGGTGKFAGATGGGTFTSLTDPASGGTQLDVAGSVTMQ